MTEPEVGQIKWFREVKGYGFIRRSNGDADVLVHFNDLRSRQDAYWVKDGDALEFAVEQTQKGPRAIDVQVLWIEHRRAGMSRVSPATGRRWYVPACTWRAISSVGRYRSMGFDTP